MTTPQTLPALHAQAKTAWLAYKGLCGHAREKVKDEAATAYKRMAELSALIDGRNKSKRP